MTEDYNDPATHCPKCDPEEEGDGTLFKYLGNSRPSFNLKGKGFFKEGWS
jgi:predicted nucleic acid-binding Zn ribbon protein